MFSVTSLVETDVAATQCQCIWWWHLLFLKTPFLILHFAYNTYCHMMLFAILRSMLILRSMFWPCGAIYIKMDGSVLDEKSSFKMPGLSFSSELNWDSYIVSTAKSACKKIITLICFLKYRSCEVEIYCSKSTIWPIDITLSFSLFAYLLLMRKPPQGY